MTTVDLSAFALDLATETKAFIAEELHKHVSALVDRCVALEREVLELKALRAIPGPAGESIVGPQGIQGEQGPPGLPGKDGQPGVNGKDVDLSLFLGMQANLSALQGEWTAFKSWQSGQVSEVLSKMVQPPIAPVIDEAAIMARVKAAVVSEIPVPKDGKDGVSIDPQVVDVMVAGAVEKAIRDIPKPQDGRSVTLEDVRPMLVTEVEKAVAALPVPKDGRDGVDGKDGDPGPQGPQGIPGSIGPIGEKGMEGPSGRDGRDGLPGVPGPMGEKGLDGRDGINGKDGIDGLHGKDGLGFDDLDVVFDQDQGYSLQFRQGERVKDIPVPFQWDAGTYAFGRLYPKGACVTDRGGYWIAQEPTRSRPPKLGEPRLASCAWRLAVKPGRDGKDAEPRKDGE